MKPQIIWGRFEYPLGDQTSDEVFEECSRIFTKEFDDRNVQVGGVCAAINCTKNTVILLSYDPEATAFLRLKFYGRKDVHVSNYKPTKVENE